MRPRWQLGASPLQLGDVAVKTGADDPIQGDADSVLPADELAEEHCAPEQPSRQTGELYPGNLPDPITGPQGDQVP